MTLVRSIWSHIDKFLAAILLTVALATLMPARGEASVAVGWLTDAAIALLFFMHGAQLSPEVALRGARHWRLHSMVFLSTFALFPLLGISARLLAPNLLPDPLWAGLILLTALPSTVQSSIAFTSVAGGNVPAALCSASASNLLGVFLTPLIAGFLLTRHGLDISARSVLAIVGQLLVPFVAGQLLRPWIGAYVTRHARALKSVDYGSILLIVYSAFSHGVVDGIWHDRRERAAQGRAGRCRAAGDRHHHPDVCQPAARLFAGRRNHHRVLRLEEKPRQRPADRNTVVRRPCRARRDSVDAVPPGSADGLRIAGAALRRAPASADRTACGCSGNARLSAAAYQRRIVRCAIERDKASNAT